MPEEIHPRYVDRLCEVCGIPFFARTRSVARGQGRFCSWDCRNKAFAVIGEAARKARTRSVEERFWEKVDRSGECWIWLAAKGEKGHGLFTFQGKQTSAHRVAYTLLRGPILDGLWVLHNCPGGDNPACVNPAHLWLGTAGDNNRDMFAKGRGATGDRHPARLHGDYLPRGDQHWSRKHPDRVARGKESSWHKHPELTRRGEEHGQSKLTEEQVREARRRVAAGESKRSVALSLGVSPHIVGRIIAGILWKHVR